MANSVDDWVFDQPRNAVAITVRSIAFNGAPILHVSHDVDDHGWQFLSGGDLDESDAAVVSMENIVRLDASVIEIANLPPGWIASRDRVGSEWKRRPHGE